MSNLPDPFIGREIGDYRITGTLGRGGVGQVYLATHKAIGKQIAIKVLQSQFAKNPIVMTRFFQEAKAVNDIQHENLIDIFNFIHDPQNEETYILMEFLRGRTLGEAIQQEAPFHLQRIGHIGLQVCSALAAAHAKGIIHRDLKSDNIFLITRTGLKDFVKVLDFGLAKLLENSGVEHITAKGLSLGTPAYMSPEQATGEKIDHRADIYALGVILYEMATAHRPFTGESSGVIMRKKVTTNPTSPREHLPQLSPGLERVIMRALERLAIDRYSSMEAMAEDLAAATDLDAKSYFGHIIASIRGAPSAHSAPMVNLPRAAASEEMLTNALTPKDGGPLSSAEYEVMGSSEVQALDYDLLTPAGRSSESSALDASLQVSPEEADELEEGPTHITPLDVQEQDEPTAPADERPPPKQTKPERDETPTTESVPLALAETYLFLPPVGPGQTLEEEVDLQETINEKTNLTEGEQKQLRGLVLPPLPNKPKT